MIGDPAGDEAADDAEAKHDRQHFGASGRAIAEIKAIGDDVDLRHGHGDAAGEPREHQ